MGKRASSAALVVDYSQSNTSPLPPSLAAGTAGRSFASHVPHRIVSRHAAVTRNGLFRCVTRLVTYSVLISAFCLTLHGQQQYLYVATDTAGSVVVIDTSSLSIVATIPIASAPLSLFMSPDGSRLYSTHHNGDGNITVINPSTNSVVTTIATPGAWEVAFSPDGSLAYVGNSAGITVIDVPTSNIKSQIALPSGGASIALTKDGVHAYVSCVDGNTRFVDLVAGTVLATIPVGGSTAYQGIAITPDGKRVYVLSLNQGQTSVIDTTSNTIIATISTGSQPLGIAITPDGTKAYIAASYGPVYVINVSTNTIAATINVRNHPANVAITADGTTVYVTDQAEGVDLIDGKTNTVVAEIATGGSPNGVALTPVPSTLPCSSGISLAWIRPTTGGNTGRVTAKISGCNFAAGAVAKLTTPGQADVIANTAVLNPGLISATFDLAGTTIGSRDLVVTNPDFTSATLPSTFAVSSGGNAALSVSVVGPGKVRMETQAVFNLVITNTGSVDSGLVSANTPIPSPFQDISPAGSSFNFTGIVPAFSSVSVPNFASSSADICQRWTSTLWRVQQTGNCSDDESFLDIDRAFLDGIYAARLFDDLLWDTAMTVPLKYGKCVNPSGALKLFCDGLEIFDRTLDATATVGEVADNFACLDALSKGCPVSCLDDKLAPYDSLVQLGNLAMVVGNDTDHIHTLIQLKIIPWDQIDALVADINSQTPTLDSLPSTIQLPTYSSGQPGGTPINQSQFHVCAVHSLDPNSKAGPAGQGVAQYLQGASPLSYTVRFENSPKATASVQEARIVDPLDPNLDVSSIALQSIQFGSTSLQIPPGEQAYSNIVDLRPQTNALVDVEAGVVNGLFVTHLTCLNPATGQAPCDPSVGFLPPDQNPPEGEGSVQFSIANKGALPTGTQIQNKATIIFDNNPAIPTNLWFNTLDVDPPVSAVQGLPSQETQATFNVSWSGTDKGSGIATYSIYVSDNGGPFTLWQQFPVSATSASYGGVNGHSYGFYSVATDAVGNTESPKSTAEASTLVNAAVVIPPPLPPPPPPPDFAVSASPSSLTLAAGKSGTVMITVTPTGSFNEAVAFTCSGLPSSYSCSFASSVTPKGGPVTTSMTIYQLSQTTLKVPKEPHGRGGQRLYAALSTGGFVGVVGLFFIGPRPRRRKWLLLLSLVIAVAAISAIVGCGGSQPSAPTGQSAVSVMARSSGIQHSVTIQLTIQ